MNALLIDCEEDRTLRAVLVGMLREAERSGPSQPCSSWLYDGARYRQASANGVLRRGVKWTLIVLVVWFVVVPVVVGLVLWLWSGVVGG